MGKILRGIFMHLKWMKCKGKSSNSRIILNDIRIETMMMRLILKLDLLVIIRMMLIIFITYLTISQMAMVVHLNIEEKEIKNLIKNLIWGLIFLNLKGNTTWWVYWLAPNRREDFRFQKVFWRWKIKVGGSKTQKVCFLVVRES